MSPVDVLVRKLWLWVRLKSVSSIPCLEGRRKRLDVAIVLVTGDQGEGDRDEPARLYSTRRFKLRGVVREVVAEIASPILLCFVPSQLCTAALVVLLPG